MASDCGVCRAFSGVVWVGDILWCGKCFLRISKAMAKAPQAYKAYVYDPDVAAKYRKYKKERSNDRKV